MKQGKKSLLLVTTSLSGTFSLLPFLFINVFFDCQRATEEELTAIRAHLAEKPELPLDRPEAFLVDLSGIPNFAERISCFMFQSEFEDAVSTTMHKLDNLKHTCEVRT